MSSFNRTRYPLGADLLVPARSVLARPRLLFSLLTDLLSGSADGEAEGVAGRATARDVPLLVAMDAPGYDRLTMLHLAHLLERLWFAIFDPDYSPHQAVYDRRLAAADARAARAAAAAAAAAGGGFDGAPAVGP